MPGSASAALVGVVVVNWNDLPRSLNCLRSLLSEPAPRHVPVLVDSGSDDDPRAAVAEVLPQATVVRLDRNAGYAAACNAGAGVALAAGATHLLLLNNDTLAERGCLAALLAAADRRPDALLGPLIVYADRPEVVWAAGGRVRRPRMENEHIGQGGARPSGGAVPVDWLSGCALFVAASTYRRLGPLDESYFLYLEDVDWSLRAARAGIPRLLVPNAVLKHEVSASASRLPTPEVIYYGCRNTYRLALRHNRLAGRALVAADLLVAALKVALRNLLYRSRREDPIYQARTRAVLDVLRRHWGPAGPARSAA